MRIFHLIEFLAFCENQIEWVQYSSTQPTTGRLGLEYLTRLVKQVKLQSRGIRAIYIQFESELDPIWSVSHS